MKKKVAVLTSQPFWYEAFHSIGVADVDSTVEIVVINTDGLHIREWERLRGIEVIGIHVDRSAPYGREYHQTLGYVRSRLRLPQAPIRPAEPELPLWVQFKQVVSAMFKYLFGNGKR